MKKKIVKKSIQFVGHYSLRLLSLPIVVIIVLLKPIIHLRFGNLRSERFGHFSSDVEVYLLTKSNNRDIKVMDVIGCPDQVCNRQLQKMWARTFRISSCAWLWSILEQELRFWTGGDTFSVPIRGHIYDYPILFSHAPILSFSENEIKMGKELQQRLGIPLGSSWICIHNRDSAFLDHFIGGNWSYHDYRDFSPQSMMVASEELVSRGYYTVRIGSHAEEKLLSKNPHIIDYCFSPLRSDFLDIYLMSNCVAYLGSDSGISSGPLIFRKPCYFVNYSTTLVKNLSHFCPWPFITKHLFHKDKGKFLSLREMVEVGLYNASQSHQFVQAGVEVISNTPDDIRDLVIEIDERLKGIWQVNLEDKELQQRFWNIIRQTTPQSDWGNIQPSIGTAFLRQHQYLLN